MPGAARLRCANGPARARPYAADRTVARPAAHPGKRLPQRLWPCPGVRAAGRPGRGVPGVALPPCEDGRAHHRHEARHRRLGRGRVPADHPPPAGLPRPLGDPHRVVRGWSPNALARHYSRFRVSERLLLTGHSHQAWPDCGFDAQARAWLDAAELVDDKWERAFAQAEAVRSGFARLLDDAPERIALGANTHELVVAFLSALSLRERPRLRSEEHTSELQSRLHLVCRLLLEKKKR